jgi:hypothetical protein
MWMSCLSEASAGKATHCEADGWGRGVCPETCICSTPDYTLGRMWAAQIAGKLRDEIAE